MPAPTFPKTREAATPATGDGLCALSTETTASLDNAYVPEIPSASNYTRLYQPSSC